MPFAEAYALVERNEIDNAVGVIALQWLALASRRGAQALALAQAFALRVRSGSARRARERE